jgi:hypothetical protein
MKQHLKYFLIFVYPFWCLLGLSYWFIHVPEWFYKLFLFSTPVINIAAFISSILIFISNLKNNPNTRNLAIRNFFYKLLHIPPLILIFIYINASAGWQPHDMEQAFYIALFFIAILIFITGLLGVAAIIATTKEHKYSKLMIPVFVLLGLGQFIFIIDVLAALILLIISFISTRKEQQKMSTNQGDPA